MRMLARFPRVRDAVVFASAALAVSAVLALRSVGARYLTVNLDRDFFLGDLRERVTWTLCTTRCGWR